MSAPFASILVRAYNDEALIARTLAGIYAQKVDFPFEVVVCDDNSTDRTREIAALAAAACRRRRSFDIIFNL